MQNFYKPSNLCLRFVIVFLFIFFFLPETNSQPVVTFNAAVSGGLTSPIDLVNAGDGSNRIFIAQQGGTIRVYNQALTFLGTFLTVTGIRTGGEEGLLSLVFSPDYETNGFFYVYYTNLSGDLELARYHVSGDPNIADAASKVIVLTISHPGQTNHNGGKLNFGIDGYLYFATGDGGGGGDVPNNAQNGNSLLGKMLRIAVNNSATPPYYTIPLSNPFVGNAAVADEIWALGLRNPFRWSFDRQTNDMWIGDVGQGAFEEIDFSPAASTGGENYGWRCYEGNVTYNTSGCGIISSYLFPVYVYPNPPSGSSAVTGGVVYRGSNSPFLQGYYMAADVYSGELFLVKSNGAGGWTTTVQNGLPSFIVSFGETENGEVYAVSLGGTVYAVSSSQVLPVKLINFSVQKNNNNTALVQWETATEENVLKFEIEFSYNGVNYQNAGSIFATNYPTGSKYTFEHYISQSGKINYRLKSIDRDGKHIYSSIVQLNVASLSKNFIYPNVITDGQLKIYINEPFTALEVIASNGAIVMKKDINGMTGNINIPISFIHKGIYIVRIKNASSAISQKVIIP